MPQDQNKPAPPLGSEEKIVIAVGDDPHGSKVVMLGLSHAGIEFMATKQTHTVDLTKIGINVKIVLFMEETQAECYELVNSAPKTDDFKNVGATLGIDENETEN